MTKKMQLIFVIVFTIWNSARAQSYSVESFEGHATKILITNYSTDNSRYGEKISCVTDSLFLTDYNGTNEVHVLNHKFLEIIYDTRGGSGYQSRNTVILSVKRNKICIAIIVNSFGKAFGSDIDGSLYVIKFNVIGNDQSNFKLLANVYDRHQSSSSPKQNYIRNRKVTLNYDSSRSIFFSAHKSITQSFTVNDPKTQQSNKQQISGLLPIVALGSKPYYYIKGQWYARGYDDNLFKEYYR
ncbi:MAG: hypothetical protein V4592_19310 [Bacteroidota bacterium]